MFAESKPACMHGPTNRELYAGVFASDTGHQPTALLGVQAIRHHHLRTLGCEPSVATRTLVAGRGQPSRLRVIVLSQRPLRARTRTAAVGKRELLGHELGGRQRQATSGRRVSIRSAQRLLRHLRAGLHRFGTGLGASGSVRRSAPTGGRDKTGWPVDSSHDGPLRSRSRLRGNSVPRSHDVKPVVEQRSDIARALTRWGRRNRREYPWREELPLWQALVAEVMLQRTRAEQVAPTFHRFREQYPSPAALGRASAEEITGLVGPLGLHWRGRILCQLAHEIARRDGELPLDPKALEALPGVGPYAAAATLSLHANRRAVLIDSNIVRVLCRLVGAEYDGETRRKRWLRDLAEAMTPPRAHRTYNYAVLDLAALVCRPRAPKCDECPIRAWCITGLERTTGDG